MTHEAPNGNTYYVDSQTGNDSFSGVSASEAWETLERVNAAMFKPGDRILFKAGTLYKGQLKPKGSGSPGKPIVISTYGTGERPRLDGDGEFQATVYLFNVEYWVVRGLEITNKGDEPEAKRRGVMVHIRDFGTAHHIHLEDLYIHDVNGSLMKQKGGGGAIKWMNEGEQRKSRFDGLLIEGCHLKRCQRNGINSWGYTRRDDWYPSLNVVIRRNLLEEIPGDGIVPIACDGALVEHNVMRNCTPLPRGQAAAGMWPWSCDNTIIQFNEASDHKAWTDGQGFDSDWNCRNTIIQYNYSHDNWGGFVLICCNGDPNNKSWNIGNIGTIVRYNISVNDGQRTRGNPHRAFILSGACRNTRIYNNLIYVPGSEDETKERILVKMNTWGSPDWPEDTLFANNIFYSKSPMSIEVGESRNTAFESNLYYGDYRGRPNDPGAVLSDPLFVNPGALPGLDTLDGYKLDKASPCIGAAVSVADNGGRDFFGNRVSEDGPRNIGIFEGLERE